MATEADLERPSKGIRIAAHPVPKGQPILGAEGPPEKVWRRRGPEAGFGDFPLREIHAIVGENGAGKSTLDQASDGRHPPHGRRNRVVWRERAAGLPTEAIDRGINAVHQEVVLCPHLTVAANMFLGDEIDRWRADAQRAMNTLAQRVLDDLGFNIPADCLLSSLTIGQHQLVATARAAMRGTQFLIFDEPTAYLTRQESAQLFRLIRRLQADGVTIVYISHRMEEVFELADRISVLARRHPCRHAPDGRDQ